jgi:hypothetical protein
MSHLHVEPENTASISMVGDGMRGPAKAPSGQRRKRKCWWRSDAAFVTNSFRASRQRNTKTRDLFVASPAPRSFYKQSPRDMEHPRPQSSPHNKRAQGGSMNGRPGCRRSRRSIEGSKDHSATPEGAFNRRLETYGRFEIQGPQVRVPAVARWHHQFHDLATAPRA